MTFKKRSHILIQVVSMRELERVGVSVQVADPIASRDARESASVGTDRVAASPMIILAVAHRLRGG